MSHFLKNVEKVRVIKKEIQCHQLGKVENFSIQNNKSKLLLHNV